MDFDPILGFLTKRMSRSRRRHHRERILRKRIKQEKQRWWGSEENLLFYARKRVNTGTVCSCSLCCNPRNSGWNSLRDGMTIQEVRQLDAANESLMEVA